MKKRISSGRTGFDTFLPEQTKKKMRAFFSSLIEGNVKLLSILTTLF